jgi:hypothetical protein
MKELFIVSDRSNVPKCRYPFMVMQILATDLKSAWIHHPCVFLTYPFSSKYPLGPYTLFSMPATVRSKTLAELYVGLGYSGELPGRHHSDLDAVLQHCDLDILAYGSPHPFNKPDSKEAKALAR